MAVSYEETTIIPKIEEGHEICWVQLETQLAMENGGMYICISALS